MITGYEDGEPAAAFRACEDRLEEIGSRAWQAAWKLAAKALAMPVATVAAGAGYPDFTYGRVATSPEDPRKFVLAEKPAGEPALIWALDPDEMCPPESPFPCDLVALSLTRPRFWRLTGVKRAVSERPDTAVEGYTLNLHQEPRAYLQPLIRWRWREAAAKREGQEAYEMVMRPVRLALGAEDIAKTMRTPEEPERRAVFMAAVREAHEARERREKAFRELHLATLPRGVLVLDPAAINWTRRGWLKGVETIEILDAPKRGPLGRALLKLNQQIDSPRGAGLIGTERDASNPRERRAA